MEWMLFRFVEVARRSPSELNLNFAFNQGYSRLLEGAANAVTLQGKTERCLGITAKECRESQRAINGNSRF